MIEPDGFFRHLAALLGAEMAYLRARLELAEVAEKSRRPARGRRTARLPDCRASRARKKSRRASHRPEVERGGHRGESRPPDDRRETALRHRAPGAHQMARALGRQLRRTTIVAAL